MMKTSILSFSAVIFGTFSMQHGLSHAQCLDTEALLQVSYNDASWKDRESVKVHVANSSTQVGSTDIEETVIEFPSSATFTFEKCFPRDDTCGHISVTGPPKEMYLISWDGQVLGEFDPELPATEDLYQLDIDGFVTSTQFGDACVPECDNSVEALFEFQLRYVDRIVDDKIRSMEYFLEDQNGNQIIFLFFNSFYGEDDVARTKAGLYVERKCLPKNDCYRLVMTDKRDFDVEHLAISFDNKTIFDDEPFYFTSINFGNGCPGEGSCDPNKESRVQFFMNNRDHPDNRPISWHLTTHDADSNSQIMYTGMEHTNTSVTLHHSEICVPKESCLTFSFAEQQEHNETSYPQFDYMVTMDDIIYRKYSYSEWRSNEERHTFHLGDCAPKLSSICNPVNETLLELNFETKPKPISSAIKFPYSFRNYFWGIFRFGEEENEEGKTVVVAQEPLFTTSNFPTTDYEYDSAYRVIKCIPNIKCVYRLTVTEDDNGMSTYESYSIKVNDTISTAETVLDPDLHGENTYVTAIDNGCSENSALSGGAIAAITVGCVVVVGALIAVFVIYKKRKA